jgi:zinc/manganese transport system substrate-binding protein
MTTRMLRRTAAATLLVALGASLLAGCSPASSPSGTPSSSSSPSATAPAKLELVASTSVWGSIAEQVAGTHTNVKVILSNPAQDPHSYEATLRDRLAVQNADLLVFNGMGYDDFMTKLNTFATGKISPLEACKSSAVEHCFYQIGMAYTVADQIAKDLSTLDPPNSADYLKNASMIANRDTELSKLSHGIVAGLDNIAVVETEPVMDPLLTDMGFTNVTPLAFTKAIEEGRDVPITALKLVQDRIIAAHMSFLAVNRQTSTAQVAALVKLCSDNGVSVVYFDELLPAGQTYHSWMRAKILEIRKLTGVDEIGANNG